MKSQRREKMVTIALWNARIDSLNFFPHLAVIRNGWVVRMFCRFIIFFFFFFISVRSCLEELFFKELITPPRFYERFCVPLRLGANWGYWPSDSVFDQGGRVHH
jgi:hypothetical protein